MKNNFLFIYITALLKKTAITVFFWVPMAGIGQQNTLSQQLVQHSQRAVQEKVFVHLDRPLYLVGETIWFKTFCVDASLHQPLDMSKVAYLEVLDKDHNPVLQTKISLEEGKGFGSVFIPPFLQSGHYSVRSYTNWMKNFSPDFYFETTITIDGKGRVFTSSVNPVRPKTNKPITIIRDIIDYFPIDCKCLLAIEYSFPCLSIYKKM